MKHIPSKLAILALLLALIMVVVANTAVPMTVSAATTTLNPNAAGSLTDADIVVVGGGTHWEACSASGGSYLSYAASNAFQTDLYSLPDPGLTGTINSVTVWMSAQAAAVAAQTGARTEIRTHAITYDGTDLVLTTSWADYSTTYVNNPNTLASWT